MDVRGASIEGMGWDEELPATPEALHAVVRTADVAGNFGFAINRPDGWRMLADVVKTEWSLRIFGPNDGEAAHAVRLDSGLSGKVERWSMMRAIFSGKKAMFSALEAEKILSEFLQGTTRPKSADWINFKVRQ